MHVVNTSIVTHRLVWVFCCRFSSRVCSYISLSDILHYNCVVHVVAHKRIDWCPHCNTCTCMHNRNTDKRIDRQKTHVSPLPFLYMSYKQPFHKSNDSSKASHKYKASFSIHLDLQFSPWSFLENGIFRGHFGGNKHFFSRWLEEFPCQVASGSLGRRHFFTACGAAHRYGHKARTLDWDLLSFLWKIINVRC